ncbi:MAG: hypothetical protein WA071_26660 [Undibacterium umbellatum]|uniref:hypothetical protein n=1 Tax=Undibacterium umbellatum TaxID=2762300 RepID=UPI003BB74FD4
MLRINQEITKMMCLCVGALLLSACGRYYDVVDDSAIKVIRRKEYATQPTFFQVSQEDRVAYSISADSYIRQVSIHVSTDHVFEKRGPEYTFAVLCQSAMVHNHGKIYRPVHINANTCDNIDTITREAEGFSGSTRSNLFISFHLDTPLGSDFQVTLPAFMALESRNNVPSVNEFSGPAQTRITIGTRWIKPEPFTGIH